MERPLASAMIPQLLAFRPSQAEAIWQKAYDDGICIKPDDFITILGAFDSMSLVKYPILDQIETLAWSALKESDCFANSKNILTTAIALEDNYKNTRKYLAEINMMFAALPDSVFIETFGGENIFGILCGWHKEYPFYGSQVIFEKAESVFISDDFKIDTMSFAQCLYQGYNMPFDQGKLKMYQIALDKVRSTPTILKEYEHEWELRSLYAYVRSMHESDFSSSTIERKIKSFNQEAKKAARKNYKFDFSEAILASLK